MKNFLYFLLIAFGAFLIMLNGFVQLHDRLSAYTIGGIIAFMMLPLIGYPFFLSIISFLSSYVVRRNNSLFLAIFSWLFFISGFFDVTVGTYTKLLLEPKVETQLYDLLNQGQLPQTFANIESKRENEEVSDKKWQDAPIIQEKMTQNQNNTELLNQNFGSKKDIFLEEDKRETDIANIVKSGKIEFLLGKWEDRKATVEIIELDDGSYKVKGDTIEENDDNAPAVAGFSFTVTKEQLLKPEIYLSDGGCEITLIPKQRTLLIKDNQSCGGMNAFFDHELQKTNVSLSHDSDSATDGTQCFKEEELIAEALDSFLMGQGLQAINCDQIDGKNGNYEELSREIVDVHKATIREFIEPLWEYTKRNGVEPEEYMANKAEILSNLLNQQKLTTQECRQFYVQLSDRKSNWSSIITLVLAELAISETKNKLLCN